MNGSDRLRSILNLNPGEGRSAALMLLHAFFMGMATVYFETAATVHFLTKFGEGAIPYAYVVAAVASTLTGLLYAKIKERVPFARLMVGTLLVLAALVVAFWIGLGLTQAAWLAFGLMIWYRIMSLLTDLEYWAVATRLYDVRQGKRLFGLIGTGEVTARIVGSFSVPLLVRRADVRDLLVLSAFGLLACVALLLLLVRQSRDELAQDKRGPGAATESGVWKQFITLCRGRYLGLMFVMTVFGVFGKYFVDFAFLQQMQSRYTEARNLAGFFGIFSGVTQVVNLLARVFISGRLLARFGVKYGLIMLPALHTVCTGLIALAGSILAGSNWVFWLVVGNQGIYKTLKHPVDNPSFKILYQPLSKRMKLSVQIAVELLVTPVALGMAGLIMILSSTVVAYDPIRFSWIMLISFTAWAVVAHRLAGQEYPKALFKALAARILDPASFSLGDESSLRVIRQSLLSPAPGDVIAALHLLEEAHPRSLAEGCSECLGHPSPDVREFAVQTAARNRLTGLVPAILGRLDVESNARVQASAVRAACELAGNDVAGRIARFLDAPDDFVRTAAMAGLLGTGDATRSVQLRERLLRWAAAPDPAHRRLAARVIVDAGRRDLAPILMPLLGDSDRVTRQLALAAAAGTDDPAVRETLLEHLRLPAFRRTAATVLAVVGERALEGLESFFERHPEDTAVQHRIAWVLGRIRGGRAARVLLKWVEHRDPAVRHRVLKSLIRCGYDAGDGSSREWVLGWARAELDRQIWRLSVLALTPAEDPWGLLRDALTYECERGRECVFLLLSLVFGAAFIQAAYANLRSVSRERRAYAIEMLDVLLPPDLKATVFLLASDDPPDRILVELRRLLPNARAVAQGEAAAAALEGGEGTLSAWTRACAAHSASRVSAGKPTGAMATAARQALVLESNPLIRETLASFVEAGEKRRTGIDAAGAHGKGPMLGVEKAIVLKSVEIFSRIPHEALADVAPVLEEKELAAGETLFRKGDPGDSMYILVSGRIRIHDGERTIAVLKDRDVLGEMAALDEEPRSASATAEEETRVLRLDRDAFFEVMSDHTQVADGVIRVLCKRLRESNIRRPVAG